MTWWGLPAEGGLESELIAVLLSDRPDAPSFVLDAVACRIDRVPVLGFSHDQIFQDDLLVFAGAVPHLELLVLGERRSERTAGEQKSRTDGSGSTFLRVPHRSILPHDEEQVEEPPLNDYISGFFRSTRGANDQDRRLEYELSRVPDVPQWTYYPPDLDEASARRRVTRTRERHELSLAGRYAVVIDGAGVGTAGMAWIEGSSPEVFYVLKPSGRGRGAATTSVRVLSEWLLAQGYLRVALGAIAGNAASERVAQRGTPVQLNRWVLDARQPSLTGEESPES